MEKSLVLRWLAYIIIFLSIAFQNNLSISDVYSWTDKNGIRHFSNTPPEETSDEFIQSNEIKYDEGKDQNNSQKEYKSLWSNTKKDSAVNNYPNDDVTPQEKEKIEREIRNTWNKMKNELKKR